MISQNFENKSDMIGTQIKQLVESEAIVHVTYSVFDTYSTSVFQCFSPICSFWPWKALFREWSIEYTSTQKCLKLWQFLSLALWYIQWELHVKFL